MRVNKHAGATSNICCNLSNYEKCICINVQGLSEYTDRLWWVHRDFWLTLYVYMHISKNLEKLEKL
jgi:hypothetical protein